MVEHYLLTKCRCKLRDFWCACLFSGEEPCCLLSKYGIEQGNKLTAEENHDCCLLHETLLQNELPPPPNFYCFPPPLPPPPPLFPFFLHHHHHHHISIVFLLLHHHISIVFYPSPTSFISFPPRQSIKDCQLPSLVHFVAMSRVVNNNGGFLQLLADCPVHQRQFLLKIATPQQLHALVQVLYNILMGHISIPPKISGYCGLIRMLYLTLPDQMSLTKQRSDQTLNSARQGASRESFWKLVTRLWVKQREKPNDKPNGKEEVGGPPS